MGGCGGRSRRASGLARRSPQGLLVSTLWSLNTRPTRWLAQYLARHNRQTYFLIALALVLGYKYQQRLRRLWRRLTTATTQDVLTEYPAERADVVGDSSSPSGSESDDEDSGDVGEYDSAKDDPDSAWAQASRATGASESGASAPLSPPADGYGSSAPVRSPGGAGGMLSPSLDQPALKFLRQMTTVTQSMDEETTALLYYKMVPLNVSKGTTLFRRGDPSDDGMYAVVSGELGVFADDEAPSSERFGSFSGAAGSGGDGSGLHTLNTSGRSGDHVGSSDPDLTQTGRSSLGGASLDSLRRELPVSPSPTFGDSSAPLCTFGVGQTVGENYLLAGADSVRAVALRATTDCQLLRLDRNTFDRFLDQTPHGIVSFILTTTARQWRVAYFTLVDFFKLSGAWKLAVEPSAPAFDPTSPTFAALRSAGSAIVEKDAGEALYNEGDTCNTVYVLRSGHASCFTTVDGHAVVSRDLEPGCVAGGVAGLVGLPHRETVRCLEDCEWVEFPTSAFFELSQAAQKSLSVGRRNALIDMVMAVARSLTPMLLQFLEHGLKRRWLAAGEMLFRQGDQSNGLYVVISGRLRTIVHPPRANTGDAQGGKRASNEDDLDDLDAFDMSSNRRRSRSTGSRNRSQMTLEVGRGEVVGELSVLTNENVRECSCVALRDCELVWLSRAAFERLVVRQPVVMQVFTRLIAKRYNDVHQRLSTYSVHGGRYVSASRVAASNLVTLAVIPAGRTPPSIAPFAKRLCKHLRRTVGSAGGQVLHLTSSKLDEHLGEGTAAHLDSMFVRSKVAAWISANEEAHRFIVFEADADPTAWSKMCVRQTDLVLLVGDSESDPDLSEVERDVLFYSEDDVGRDPDSAIPVARGPMSPGGAATNSARSYLDGTRKGSGLSRFLRRASSFGESHPPRPPITRSTSNKAPTSRTLRRRSTHAMRVALRSRTLSRKELVLLHRDPNKSPRGTRNWLRLRRVGCHHHVRVPIAGDYGRVARHVCGCATGVVFGGGGARGLAHLGVLEAMQDQEIPVDFIGGTSQGAFMAGCYAMTLDLDECVRGAAHLAGAIGSIAGLISDATLPLVSYFSGANFNEALQDVFGDTQIEDLWIRYFCISTNVTTYVTAAGLLALTPIANDVCCVFCRSSMVVHETGPLWRYARASMTVLGLLPPLLDNGELLVDGGYTNNLPVDVMREFAPATVVAVDVEDKSNPVANVEDYGDSLSGWWLAWRWLLSLLRLADPVQIPRTPDVAIQLSYISHNMALRELLRQGLVDDSIVYMAPDVQGYKLLDYDKIEDIVDAGRKEGLKRLRRWRRRREGSDEADHRRRSSLVAAAHGLVDGGEFHAPAGKPPPHSISFMHLHRLGDDADGSRGRTFSTPLSSVRSLSATKLRPASGLEGSL